MLGKRFASRSQFSNSMRPLHVGSRLLRRSVIKLAKQLRLRRELLLRLRQLRSSYRRRRRHYKVRRQPLVKSYAAKCL
eukprot:4387975-Pyramimonas_sp.AAC.1